MNKWVKVGAALLAVAWAPFLYAELSRDSTEQKERVLPADTTHDDSAALQAAEGSHDDTAAKGAVDPAAEAPAEPAAAETEPGELAAPAAAPPSAAVPPPAAPNAPTAVPADPPAGPGAEQVQQLAAPPGDPAATAAVAKEPAEGSDELAEEPAAEDEPEPTPPTSSGPSEALKQAYDQQPRDALWAADAEAKIGALFGTEEVPAELLRSASCRKAVCRVELRWTSARAGAYVSAYEAAQRLLGGEVGVEPVGSPSDKGEQQVNLYLTRKGYTVADLTR